jgi:hypothetical protein
MELDGTWSRQQKPPLPPSAWRRILRASAVRSSVNWCQMAFSDSRKLLRKSREMTCLDFSHEFGSCFRLTHGQTPQPPEKLGLKARGEPKVPKREKMAAQVGDGRKLPAWINLDVASRCDAFTT